MKKTIQIPQGNEFSLFVPFVVLSKNGRADASAALWNNVQVVVRMSNKQTDIPHTTALQEQYVIISFDNSLKLGSYDVIISGEYEGRNVSAPLNNLFSVTNWADGNYAEFVVGQPIECPTQTIIGQFNTTQDIIDLTEELRAALAAAEAAKEEYEEKVEELSNVAQQGTNPDATNTAILTAIGNISIDTTTIAKQGNNPNTDLSQVASDVTDLGTALNQAAVILAKQGNNVEATLSDTQTAAQNAAAAVKDGNDTAVGVAKEVRSEVGTGSDTAAETGTLFAVVKWVKDKVKSIFNLIGSPATGQPATLFAAIAAGGGGGSADALETEVETGKTAIADAIVQKGGTATATDSLAQLATEVQNIPNVTKSFVQTDFIEQWTGSTSMDCLAIIHQYYNPLYPTAQCYAVFKGSTLTIPSGVDKMIYYNTSGVLTTIDNPSGAYGIGAPSGEIIGFCLLQYASSNIQTITFSPINLIDSFAAYNAEIYISGFGGSSITLVQLEKCIVDFGNNAFEEAQITAFVMYEDSSILNDTITANNLFRNSNLRTISIPTLKSIAGTRVFENCNSLIYVNLPNLSNGAQYMFNGMQSMRVLWLPLLKTSTATGSMFYGANNLIIFNLSKWSMTTVALSSPNRLIDLMIGAEIRANLSINAWNPTEALLTTSSSLVFAGETFANNREKLLYNIRNHFAANLPDRTGQTAITITFASAMKTAINGDTTTAQAFTSKNYTIA